MLNEYRAKRDFAKTPEPKPTAPTVHRHPIFVIQKHNARRLHYDFRLEHDGVLKSWAVPKGPSEDPHDKRLAVQTEDHPLDYATFEGEIPKGEYGAGTVEVWDSGKYVNITVKGGKVQPLGDAIAAGHFLIYIKGKKLHGSYAFTRTKDKNWILVKMREREMPPPQSSTVTVGGIPVKLTNLRKELDAGIPKAELVAYYQQIAPLMLPHVEGRPVSMYRFPDGVAGEKFFQKDSPKYFPKWLPCEMVHHSKSDVCYPIIHNEAGIVYLGNQVVVPHITATRISDPLVPDKLVFDLDPSVEDLSLLKDAAQRLGRFLRSLGFHPYIMTTGGKGYHVTAPIVPELPADQVRDFAFKIATVLARDDPTHLTTELRKDKRKDRIFVDVNRLSPMQTSVAPYAARSKPGLPVAAPFPWDELVNIDPTSYTIQNPPKQDAWKDFFTHAVSVKTVREALMEPQVTSTR
jgi:bifunctional non-homologous end joining protein LigD